MEAFGRLIGRIEDLVTHRPDIALRKASHLKALLGRRPLTDDPIHNAQRFALIDACRRIVTEAKLAIIRRGGAVPADPPEDPAPLLIFPPRSER